MRPQQSGRQDEHRIGVSLSMSKYGLMRDGPRFTQADKGINDAKRDTKRSPYALTSENAQVLLRDVVAGKIETEICD